MPHDLSLELRQYADHVARTLLGEPDRKASQLKRGILCFGRHGSVKVNCRTGLWFDFEACKGGDLLALIQREEGCDFPDALKRARELLGLLPEDNGAKQHTPRPKPKSELETDTEDDAARTRRALRIWREAEPIEGTPGALCLRGVDLDVVPDLHAVLRWHPRSPWGDGVHGCIVALWTDIVTGEPKAIHRRLITAAGEKADRWKALGPTGDCVIRLWPDDAVTTAVVLGEGIETVLAGATNICHRGTLLQPAWAAGDAGHLWSLPVLPGVEALTLLVDADDTGQDAAAECAERWTAAGREAIRLTPRNIDADFNDIVMGST
jgi:hypothetical protein